MRGIIGFGGFTPEKGLSRNYEETSKEHDAVLIFDEVVSGFHLAFGAQEYFGITPYLAVFGKALGDYPYLHLEEEKK